MKLLEQKLKKFLKFYIDIIVIMEYNKPTV